MAIASNSRSMGRGHGRRRIGMWDDIPLPRCRAAGPLDALKTLVQARVSSARSKQTPGYLQILQRALSRLTQTTLEPASTLFYMNANTFHYFLFMSHMFSAFDFQGTIRKNEQRKLQAPCVCTAQVACRAHLRSLTPSDSSPRVHKAVPAASRTPVLDTPLLRQDCTYMVATVPLAPAVGSQAGRRLNRELCSPKPECFIHGSFYEQLIDIT